MTGDLTIGALLESENAAPARLLASKMNRHTFWCGQSGSGKTYALGVALEQILLHTKLPLVILDPNSDFVKLGDIRDDAPAAEAAELATRDIRVRRATVDAEQDRDQATQGEQQSGGERAVEMSPERSATAVARHRRVGDDGTGIRRCHVGPRCGTRRERLG